MDQVVVLLIGLPPSTPNPWSAQIRPNSARINPTCECSDESRSHIGILRAIWSAPFENVDRRTLGTRLASAPVASQAVGIRRVAWVARVARVAVSWPVRAQPLSMQALLIFRSTWDVVSAAAAIMNLRGGKRIAKVATSRGRWCGPHNTSGQGCRRTTDRGHQHSRLHVEIPFLVRRRRHSAAAGCASRIVGSFKERRRLMWHRLAEERSGGWDAARASSARG